MEADPKQHRLPGFTLLEVVAVMAIIALLTTLVLPRITNDSSPTKVRAAAFQMASLLRQTRMEAIDSGDEQEFILDILRREAHSSAEDSGIVTFPPGADITHEVSTRCEQVGSKVRVVFQPDGRSCGSQVTLRIDGLIATVQTDWLAGKSKVTFIESPS